MAVNEHFCMSLASRMGLPAAEVDLLLPPRPVLVVQPFDHETDKTGDPLWVRRQHIMDTCQTSDLASPTMCP